MRSLATFILFSAAALVRANPSNPCLNNEDELFPDPKGDEKLRKLTLINPMSADCSSFYECIAGQLVGHTKCPDGLFWNNELQICDWNAGECWLDGWYQMNH